MNAFPRGSRMAWALRRPRMLAAIGLGLICLAAPAGAAARPRISLRLPLRGAHVAFACANPVSDVVGGLFAYLHPNAARPARCLGEALASRSSKGPLVTGSPSGYGPAQLQGAYGLTSASAADGAGETVAIVDAFNDPNAASDLSHYRSAMGLPACPAGTCFKKVGENGGSSLPSGDPGWGLEESLDIETVSAICPKCNIVLVEANSASIADLSAAAKTAGALPGVVAVSNSYGGSETSNQTRYDGDYSHSGVAYTAAAGDSGYGVLWPASSSNVTAVGGTTLSVGAGNVRSSETVWSGSGSGCSTIEAKPTWQADAGCTKRTNNDVAADADPNTGFAEFDTYNGCGSGFLCDLLIGLGLIPGADGWVQVGGTSLSSPIIASVYALAGGPGATPAASIPYAHAGSASLFDVTSGSDGSCSPAYLCTAGPGYDGPTGVGTPNGIGAF